MRKCIFVTGGAGFIGSNFVHRWLETAEDGVVNIDALTYAGNLESLQDIESDGRHVFVQANINDRTTIARLLNRYFPWAIVHFAAESHVDRSISGPEAFLQTNVMGTFALLEETRAFWQQLEGEERDRFRFLHVSTDEVYGTLSEEDPAFTEQTPYAPNSPYSASKAGSDHLVRAYHHTYGLPTLTTNCSNNYGPYQFPEKLIPLMILNGLEGKSLPVYGDGKNVRDWLYVVDHCDAISEVLRRGRVGETYNVGGCNEMQNIEVVRTICRTLDTTARKLPQPREALITFVKDRPGHDRRYAIDIGKIQRELGWRPKESFDSGMRKTIEWYLANLSWCEHVRSGEYQRWIESHYASQG